MDYAGDTRSSDMAWGVEVCTRGGVPQREDSLRHSHHVQIREGDIIRTIHHHKVPDRPLPQRRKIRAATKSTTTPGIELPGHHAGHRRQAATRATWCMNSSPHATPSPRPPRRSKSAMSERLRCCKDVLVRPRRRLFGNVILHEGGELVEKAQGAWAVASDGRWTESTITKRRALPMRMAHRLRDAGFHSKWHYPMKECEHQKNRHPHFVHG